MKIQKRNGKFEPLSVEKVMKRMKSLANDTALGPALDIDTDTVSLKVINQIYDGVSSSELDDSASKIAISMSIDHPGYGHLASRIAVSNMHKSTPNKFSKAVSILYKAGAVNKKFHAAVVANKKVLDDAIDDLRDYQFDYFGFKTLEKGYLLKVDKETIERPQHMWMRVALSLHQKNIDRVLESYHLLSQKYFTHASPTLFNAGTLRLQNSSCFLLDGSCDSVDGIFKTITDCAHISKFAGGIGFNVSGIRAKGSKIYSTNGCSDGIVPMLKVYNETSRYINQAGKRNGSFAVYIEPHHADIFDFLELKKNTGDVNLRARDLFYALWVSDLFMERVEADGDWYLMCPNECKGLENVYGDEYVSLYNGYVAENKYRTKIKARDLWNTILVSQIETGMPYMSYKDHVNRKSNQKHIGVIKNSNLCVAPETMVLTSEGHYHISALENTTVDVWNGEEFTSTIVVKTGEGQELLRVRMSSGSELECTPYHKFYIKVERGLRCIEARELEPGMVLLESKFPVIKKGSMCFPFPYERACIQNLNLRVYVPVNFHIDIKLWWLEGIFDKCGSVDGDCVYLESTLKENLDNIRYLMQTLGCDPKIKAVSDKFVLIVGGQDIRNLQCLYFRPKKLKLPLAQSDVSEQRITVEEIVYTGRVSDTYCFTEEKRGMGIFNGTLTGQCNEITLVSRPDSIAVCNIATLGLPMYIEDGKFNFDRLGEVTRVLVRNLNNVIDVNFYPVPEAEKNNKQERPIAIGVQGLYDVFMRLRYPFDSPEAKELNKKIFETIQYCAIHESCELAKLDGAYSTFKGSPASQGIFQHNMWDIDETQLMHDWTQLRKDVIEHGLRNSLLTALPPTASTSQILGNVESFEVLNNNFYMRRVLSGNYPIINKYLVNDLISLGLWNSDIKNRIISDDGSIQNISEIPAELKKLYKTTWETSQKTTIDLSADRGPFIDHSQSLNIFMAVPTISKLSSMHFYGWRKGCKTGMYYLRSLPASTAEKFTVVSEADTAEKEALMCSLDNREECEMCSG
jgi:ribonucleoside-diphosphate reductase alpha chain